MHFDFKGIMQGSFNSVFVNQEIEKVAETRTTICDTCPWQSENKKRDNPDFKTIRPDVHCTHCGCNLHMKTRSMSQTCPLTVERDGVPAKWPAVISQSQEWLLDSKLDQAKKKPQST